MQYSLGRSRRVDFEGLVSNVLMLILGCISIVHWTQKSVACGVWNAEPALALLQPLAMFVKNISKNQILR